MFDLAMLLFVLLGVVAGSLSGLLGIGGGAILVPALVFLFGMSQHTAQGTTLALMVPPIGLLAAWLYYRKSCVDLRISGLLAVGFAVGAYLGAQVANDLSAAILERAFGVLMIFLAYMMLARTKSTSSDVQSCEAIPAPALTPLKGLAFVLLGLLAGSLSGLLGIGGGVVLIPCLVLFFGLTQHQAQGTTLALMVLPIGLGAAWQYFEQGHVNLEIGALICVGFVVGGLLGAKLASVLPSRILQRVFGIAMLIIAIKMLLF